MMKCNGNCSDSTRFDAAVSHIFTTPKSEIDKRMAAEKAGKAAKTKATRKG
jgi:hypothetical protein